MSGLPFWFRAIGSFILKFTVRIIEEDICVHKCGDDGSFKGLCHHFYAFQMSARSFSIQGAPIFPPFSFENDFLSLSVPLITALTTCSARARPALTCRPDVNAAVPLCADCSGASHISAKVDPDCSSPRTFKRLRKHHPQSDSLLLPQMLTTAWKERPGASRERAPVPLWCSDL